jgi:hypothetical protein
VEYLVGQRERIVNKNQKLLGLTLFLALMACLGIAQRTAREMPGHSTEIPHWTNDPAFPQDAFTFVRIKYDVNGKHGYGHTPGGPTKRWLIDAPDSDLNFSFRLQQMTSIKVNPDGLFLELTDKELFNYPFIYIVEPGRLTFSEQEAEILRRYLLNGGFLMLDDFWGEREWKNFHEELKMVFPDRESVPLSLDHPIFHCIFNLEAKPQVPGIPHIVDPFSGQLRYPPGTEPTYEQPDAKEVDYRAIYDDKGRMMVLICHNTDLGDGWEREGENEYYFREYCEKKAFPLGINIIYYAMTH